jgi:hypothetical protein
MSKSKSVTRQTVCLTFDADVVFDVRDELDKQEVYSCDECGVYCNYNSMIHPMRDGFELCFCEVCTPNQPEKDAPVGYPS